MTSDILSARFRLHRRIIDQTENFLWLLDTQYNLDPDFVHPLDLPDVRSVQFTQGGSLIISHSSTSRLANYESTMYMGSNKSWIVPMAQFSLMNPEKCRRMVSYLYFYY